MLVCFIVRTFREKRLPTRRSVRASQINRQINRWNILIVEHAYPVSTSLFIPGEMITTRPRFTGLVAVLLSVYFIVVTTVTVRNEFPRIPLIPVRRLEPFVAVSTPKHAGVII